MIYVMQGGRCGNQLFVYAFARSLQLKYPNEEIVFDFCGLKIGQEKYKNGLFWEDSLSRFNVINYNSINCSEGVVSQYGTKLQKMVLLIWRVVNKLIKDNTSKNAGKIRSKLLKFTSRFGIYFIQFGYAPYKLTNTKHKFAWGSFEDPRWFEDIREILLKEYTPRLPLKDENKELYEIITKCNSVCVSLRKWALDIHEDDNLSNRDLCDSTYYEKAIEIIQGKVHAPVFIVFSDDVEWAKETIKSISGDAMVYSESGNDDVAEKIRLMSACKHFIISNSTFGWWPQYLCTNENRIVISPDRWLDSFEDRHPLIMDDWILIKTRNGGK